MNSTTKVELPRECALSASWEHNALWRDVKEALSALPMYFHSDTFIDGVSALDIFALNSFLSTTIENQIVETLNKIRNMWDPQGLYGLYNFVRQPQSFPDVVLKNLSDPTAQPLLGIELKGWYLLAKEGEPSMRFTQTENACAEADMIMVVPWVLSSVISGRPAIFSPYIERAKCFQPGVMDDYLRRMMVQSVCGIQARYWLEFFKIFHQDATEETIKAAFKRMRDQVGTLASPTLRAEFQSVIAALEQLARAENNG